MRWGQAPDRLAAGHEGPPLGEERIAERAAQLAAQSRSAQSRAGDDAGGSS